MLSFFPPLSFSIPEGIKFHQSFYVATCSNNQREIICFPENAYIIAELQLKCTWEHFCFAPVLISSELL